MTRLGGGIDTNVTSPFDVVAINYLNLLLGKDPEKVCYTSVQISMMNAGFLGLIEY